ncbi:hypothetical protein VS883_28395, partial [Escherichia coli]
HTSQRTPAVKPPTSAGNYDVLSSSVEKPIIRARDLEWKQHPSAHTSQRTPAVKPPTSAGNYDVLSSSVEKPIIRA